MCMDKAIHLAGGAIISPLYLCFYKVDWHSAYLSNRSLSQVISADYFRRKRLSQSAVDDADAHYIG